jgi:hypothetical protein
MQLVAWALFLSLLMVQKIIPWNGMEWNVEEKIDGMEME